MLARAGRHPGAGVLRRILAEHSPGSTRTRNDLEEAFLAICRAARFPQPEVNVWIPLEPTGDEPRSVEATLRGLLRQAA